MTEINLEMCPHALAMQFNVSNIIFIKYYGERGCTHFAIAKWLYKGCFQEDLQRRIHFCEWLLQHEAYNSFVMHTLWTDEECFTRKSVTRKSVTRMREKEISQTLYKSYTDTCLHTRLLHIYFCSYLLKVCTVTLSRVGKNRTHNQCTKYRVQYTRYRVLVYQISSPYSN